MNKSKLESQGLPRGHYEAVGINGCLWFVIWPKHRWGHATGWVDSAQEVSLHFVELPEDIRLGQPLEIARYIPGASGEVLPRTMGEYRGPLPWKQAAVCTGVGPITFHGGQAIA